MNIPSITIIISAPTYLPTYVPHSLIRTNRTREEVCVETVLPSTEKSLGSRYRCSSAAVSYYYCYYYCFASFLHILHYIHSSQLQLQLQLQFRFVSFRQHPLSNSIFIFISSHTLPYSSLFSCLPFPPFTNITIQK